MKDKKRAKKSEPGGKPKRVPFRHVPAKTWKMKGMPTDLKEQFDALIGDGTFHTSSQLKKWLGDNGFEISSRSIRQYGENFERRLDAIRMATEQARIVCEEFKDDDAKMQTALLRLVQTRLFELLAVANEKPGPRKRGSAKIEPAKIAPVNIAAMARTVSGLVKAETEHQKWAEHTREKVAAVEQKVEDARAKGLSKNAADQIRSVLMEI
ncbi:phage protein Gp27 family protein [Candidatus Binatus sp.]|uniref:phage protein Gp27 family protein n=1 Tax=Candidatus Binatus sp. TaxID=2811406 RepID=UPI002F92D508